ncbi:MAG: META domain-containing protein [Anaerolineales bacterium]
MLRKSITLLWLVCVALLTTAGCQSVEGSKTPTLDGSNWELFAYGKTKPILGTTITANFSDGEIRGTAGCNSYFGSYTTDGMGIEFGELGWTAMACLNPPGVMEQETLVMEFFMNAERFELEDGRLYIYRTDGEALTFDRLN